MSQIYSHTALALFAGAILAIMIKLNSSLALLSTPLTASWVAHGLGAITALIMLQVFNLIRQKKHKEASKQTINKAPWYAYLGGLPGAFTVVLAAITVNSPLGLAGTLALALLGQIVFSLMADHFALFASKRRQLGWQDIKVLSLILSGCLFIIFSRSIL